MKPEINNIIRIPCKSELDFFRFWLIFLKPFHSLSPKVLEVASYILYTRYIMTKSVLDKDLLDDLVLGKSSRRQIAEYCGIPSNQLDVHITNLRKAGFIVDNKVNPKYIPNYNNEDSFKFLIMFDITKE